MLPQTIEMCEALKKCNRCNNMHPTAYLDYQNGFCFDCYRIIVDCFDYTQKLLCSKHLAMSDFIPREERIRKFANLMSEMIAHDRRLAFQIRMSNLQKDAPFMISKKDYDERIAEWSSFYRQSYN